MAAAATEEDTELRDLLVQTLESSGVLNKIKVGGRRGSCPPTPCPAGRGERWLAAGNGPAERRGFTGFVPSPCRFQPVSPAGALPRRHGLAVAPSFPVVLPGRWAWGSAGSRVQRLPCAVERAGRGGEGPRPERRMGSARRLRDPPGCPGGEREGSSGLPPGARRLAMRFRPGR